MSGVERGGERQNDARMRRAPSVSTIAGCLLILASWPLFLLVAPHLSDLALVAAGVAALIGIWGGIALAARGLGLFRKRSSSVEQPGWPALIFNLIALLGSAFVIIYVVYYGARRAMGG